MCNTRTRTSTPKKKTRAHHRHSVERFGARDAGYVRAKCRFARSFITMSRSPLAFTAGLACVFVLTFAPRADAWNPNPNKLLPYEHCTGEGGECTCNGIARWGWPMDTEKHPEYEDGYQWVRPPPNAPRTRLRLARSRSGASGASSDNTHVTSEKPRASPARRSPLAPIPHADVRAGEVHAIHVRAVQLAHF